MKKIEIKPYRECNSLSRGIIDTVNDRLSNGTDNIIIDNAINFSVDDIKDAIEYLMGNNRFNSNTIFARKSVAILPYVTSDMLKSVIQFGGTSPCTNFMLGAFYKVVLRISDSESDLQDDDDYRNIEAFPEVRVQRVYDGIESYVKTSENKIMSVDSWNSQQFEMVALYTNQRLAENQRDPKKFNENDVVVFFEKQKYPGRRTGNRKVVDGTHQILHEIELPTGKEGEPGKTILLPNGFDNGGYYFLSLAEYGFRNIVYRDTLIKAEELIQAKIGNTK